MQTKPIGAIWRAHAEPVQGRAHRKAEKVCQDHAIWVADSYGTLIMALADGHGSERSPHSEIGADYAVRAARSQLEDFAAAVQGQSLDVVQRYAEEELPRRIAKEWIDRVRKREQDQPDLGSTLIRYGSTLLAVLITHTYVVYLQLGDGDILRVGSDGEVVRPIPPNPAHFANATNSLSMVDRKTGQPNGWLQMDVRVEPLAELADAPALIVLATDGYANSFVSDADFLRVGPDILRLIREHGWQWVRAQLPGWLHEATYQGSGDDVTVGLIWNAARPGV